ncbi:hypothetical protein SCACP_11770 [Sporomusa carbonis]
MVMRSCDIEFIKELVNILEMNNSELSETIVLRNGNWDSLAVLSTISLIDELYNVTVPGKQLMECSTIGDIITLIQKAQQ